MNAPTNFVMQRFGLCDYNANKFAMHYIVAWKMRLNRHHQVAYTHKRQLNIVCVYGIVMEIHTAQSKSI